MSVESDERVTFEVAIEDDIRSNDFHFGFSLKFFALEGWLLVREYWFTRVPEFGGPEN